MTEQILTGVGEELKHAREAAGLAVGDVAHRLKLLPRQIESLEQERFERLPGPAIARTMVRKYARLLELDPEPLEQRMAPRRETPPDSAVVPCDGERLPSAGSSRRPVLRYVVIAAVLAVVTGIVAYEWQHAKPAPAFVEPVAAIAPLRAVAPAAPVAPTAPPRPEPAPVAREQPLAAPVAKPPEGVESPIAEKPQPEATTERAAAPGAHRLVMRMEQEAWLEVRDGTGRSLVSSLNPAGTQRAVRGQAPFQLVIGNAAHVRLTYDGKPVDLEPHTSGEVARFTLP